MLRNTLAQCDQPLLSLLSASTWDACHQVPLSSDLSHLVREIQALRGQLEQSIQVNNSLRLQLEQQLDGGSSKANLSPSSISHSFPADSDPGNKQPLFQGRKKTGIREPSASGEVTRMFVVEGTILRVPCYLRSGRNGRYSSTVPGESWDLGQTCCLQVVCLGQAV